MFPLPRTQRTVGISVANIINRFAFPRLPLALARHRAAAEVCAPDEIIRHPQDEGQHVEQPPSVSREGVAALSQPGRHARNGSRLQKPPAHAAAVRQKRGECAWSGKQAECPLEIGASRRRRYCSLLKLQLISDV